MAQSGDDPIVNAVVSPEASRFVRLILRSALANPTSDLTAGEIAEAQALFANVIMNDILNRWNTDLNETVDDAQANVGKALNFDATLPLALHARGLVKRKKGDPSGAFSDFDDARNRDRSFARGHAQAGNQTALNGQPQNSHQDFKKARNAAPNHPAMGYFDWGEGRAFVQEKKWADAIDCLKRSVLALPTVWYNRAYLAAAQDASGDATVLATTKTDYIRIFGRPTPDFLASLLPSSSDPPSLQTARQRVHDLLAKW